MTPAPVIIDCDPGQDDAINLFLAFGAPEQIDVIGITTVAGNSPLALTERNARMLCQMIGRSDVPVFAGCDRPLLVPPILAEHVHGKSGIDGIDVFEPSIPLQRQHAVDSIVETVMAHTGRPITLVATGPLTNIATALIKEPRIADRVERLILMGGAMREAGNITPSAEFNMRVDPHAAQRVFASGLAIVAISLDITHQVLVSRARLEAIAAIGNPIATAVYDMLSFSERFDLAKYGTDGAPLHDACTMSYLLRPDLFKTKQISLTVEVGSPLTLGHTSVDYWGITSNKKNVAWAFDVDSAGLFENLITILKRYEGGQAPIRQNVAAHTIGSIG